MKSVNQKYGNKDEERIIPWWQPEINDKDKDLVLEVLEGDYPNEGSYTSIFEEKISDLLGVKYAVAVTSGTTAIFLSLKALGIGHGDEVIVPDITFIATANAVDMCGATPVLADVDATSLTIDSTSVENAITKRTKAIIPVHLSGRPADMTNLTEIADRYGLKIIEDAAEGFMSKYKGKYLGVFGVTGCFSFSPNKIITTGQGGMITTDEKAIYEKLIELKDQGRSARGTGGDDIHYSRGYNFKFTNIQAALGLGQLTSLMDRINRLKRTYTIYTQCLAELEQVSIYPFNLYEGELPIWTDAIVEHRNELLAYLESKYIKCRKYWYPLHRQEPYRDSDYKFPISTRLSPQALWLPSAFTLGDDDIGYVCGKIKEFFGST